MTRFQYVTAEQVMEAHEILLKKYGGLEGGGHRGSSYEGVEAAVKAVENAYYENIYELAAAYAVYIVQGHVFLDGNKRAASFAMFEFLWANKTKTRISPERSATLMIEMQRRSENGESADSLIRWIAVELTPRKRR